ncbi:MAG TPA: NAD(P)H-dependent oxidoreductase [Candidatus Thermoplasmatota archaeon]|nr:NAD(P)H-dependent oxidoreductase [Candidatus Thermoplasmatota archaeon]
MRLVFIAGSPRRKSRTRVLVERARDHARNEHPECETDLLDLAATTPEPFKDWETEYSDATRNVVERVLASDAMVVGSPVFNGSYSSAVKNLFEHIDYKELEGMVAGFIVVGGGDQSFLQVRAHLAQLMAYYRVPVVPRAVFATEEQVDEGPPEKILKRIDRLVDATFAAATGARAAADAERKMEREHAPQA